MEKLTIARIKDVEFAQNEVKLWDGAVGGLCLRCFASGARTWAYRYRDGSGGRSAKVRTLKLGSWPALGIDGARAAAKAHAALVAQGHDPAALKREQRRQQSSALGALLALDGPYQRSLEARGIVNAKKVMSVLRRGLARHANVDVARLSRRDFAEALSALDDRPGARAELRKHSRGLLEWAVNSGQAAANVLAGMRLPPKSRAQRLEEAAKRRALDDGAIRAVWRAADRHGQYGAIVQLALLTAMRRSEIAHLRWDDVLGDRILVAPERAKTGVAHEIPLTSLMQAVIARQPRTTSPLLFPGRVQGKPPDGWSSRKRALVTAAGVGHFTLHDLRRTTRTLMDRLGIAEAVAELAIGHVRGGLIGLYALDPKWAARVDVFGRVSDHIARLIA